MDIKGAVVSITGAARGIGRTLAEAFAERGAKVGISDVLGDDLARTAAEMKEAGRTVLPVLADVTDVSQVEEMVAKVEAEFGPCVRCYARTSDNVAGPPGSGVWPLKEAPHDAPNCQSMNLSEICDDALLTVGRPRRRRSTSSRRRRPEPVEGRRRRPHVSFAVRRSAP